MAFRRILDCPDPEPRKTLCGLGRPTLHRRPPRTAQHWTNPVVRLPSRNTAAYAPPRTHRQAFVHFRVRCNKSSCLWRRISTPNTGARNAGMLATSRLLAALHRTASTCTALWKRPECTVVCFAIGLWVLRFTLQLNP